MSLKIFQSGNNVAELGYRTPVIFGREILNPWFNETSINARLPKLYLMILAASGVVFEHIRETLLELECQSFSHDSNTIDGVDERLSLGFEKIADQYRNHNSLTQEKIYFGLPQPESPTREDADPVVRRIFLPADETIPACLTVDPMPFNSAWIAAISAFRFSSPSNASSNMRF